MFEKLTDRLQGAVRQLRGRGRITEDNIKDGIRNVRLALLEADVHVSVVKDLIAGVKEKALGQEVLQSLSPDQHFIKILNEELVRVLGEGQAGLAFPAMPPGVILLAGLQGSGKTTTAGKLARYFMKDGHSAMLVPADVHRPAARRQLEVVASEVGAEFFAGEGGDAVKICRKAVEAARKSGVHRVIVDTAGRLDIDDELMEELAAISNAVKPDEIGTAKAFHGKVNLTGVVLSKADGDARGGAALSVKAVTGLPVKLVGVGEKMDALEPFYPDRMASRILGMGDVLGLIEKAQEAVEEKEAEAVARKLRKGQFTLDDFRDQLRYMKKLGPIGNVLGMVPGMGGLKGFDPDQVDEGRLKRIQAVLDSMTPFERSHHKVLDGSRRRRIARGAGVSIAEVNQVVKQYLTVRKMMQQLKKSGMKGMMRSMRGRFR
ncbi:MAG: signal recognition particle protein [Acidobacteriota bacterium]